MPLAKTIITSGWTLDLNLIITDWATGGTRPYHPSIKIYNQMAATFGVVGGAIVEERYQVEVGIYKSDYRVNVDLLTESGDVYFANTPINTFTSYMVPFNFNVVKTWQGKYEPRHFIYGTGVTLLAGTKMGLTETFFSPESTHKSIKRIGWFNLLYHHRQ